MDPVKETEKLLRSKLEQTGQLAKMRAMVAEASLKVLDNEDTSLFQRSKLLESAKQDKVGLHTLAAVVEYLEHLGLGYSASVLNMEAGLKTLKLPAKDELGKAHNSGSEPVLQHLIKRSLAGEKSASVTPSPQAVVASVPAAAAAAPAAAVPAPVAKVVSKSKSIETLYEIAEWEDREFTRYKQVAGQQVQLWNLKRCKVFVFDPLDSMTVDDVFDSELVVAACEGSVFLRNCKNMTVYIACKQLRLRDCENLDIRLFATTDPVVEKSHRISFKPFNIRAPGMIAGFKSARLDPAINRFVHVYDFTADDPELSKPHFTVHFPDHGLSMINVGEASGTPECPAEIEDLLAGRLQPAHSSEAGASKSLNIKTGSSSWKEQAAPAQPQPQPVPTPQPTPTPAPAAVPAAAPIADDNNYSSYSDSTDSDENYAVDEDEDDF